MSRPITMFTGQWADIPLEELAKKMAEIGYDGLELALRSALRSTYGSERPSSGVWNGIQDGIQGRLASRDGFLGSRSKLRSMLMLQGVALVALLAVLGAGLDSEFRGRQASAVMELEAKVASADGPVIIDAEDALSGFRIMRSANEMTLMDYRLAPFVETTR